MQSISMTGIMKLFQTGKEQGNSKDIGKQLAKSGIGLEKGMDSFSITKTVTQLLNPTCGMSAAEKQAYEAKIMQKLNRGKKLSGEEMQYLQMEDPALYAQAARVQAMRESLETQLKQSKSKKEVMECYTNAISQISESDSMKEALVAAYDDVMKEFQKSDEYQTLPEEENRRKQWQQEETKENV